MTLNVFEYIMALYKNRIHKIANLFDTAFDDKVSIDDKC